MLCPLPGNTFDICNTEKNLTLDFGDVAITKMSQGKRMFVILLLSFSVLIDSTVTLEVYILSDLLAWV